MRIILLNGSPKGDDSDTLTLSRAFTEGMNEEFERIDLIDWDVLPCKGCMACRTTSPGKCVQMDDAAMLLQEIVNADLVIWSMPLYAYGMPSHVKALIDRLLPLSSPVQPVIADEKKHRAAKPKPATAHVLISGCGFPDFEGSFDSLVMEFRRFFGQNSACLLCAESPILNVAEAQSLVKPYLAIVRKAGQEYAATRNVSAETQKLLAIPMLNPAIYRQIYDGENGMF